MVSELVSREVLVHFHCSEAAFDVSGYNLA